MRAQRRDAGAPDGAGAAADGDHGEHPIALALGVEVVGVRPELRDEEHVDDAEPDEEGQPERHAGPAEREEQRERADHGGQTQVEQTDARHLAGQRAVGGHHAEQDGNRQQQVVHKLFLIIHIATQSLGPLNNRRFFFVSFLLLMELM